MTRSHLAWTAGVVAAGLVIVGIYAWPGYMAYDSVVQLDQARSGALTDWHPPVMSALWGVLDRLVAGPALMFVLQIAMFVGGVFLLLCRRTSPRTAAIATLAILALPSTLTLMSVVVKDCLMCGALLLGVAALTSGQRWARIASLGLFVLAAAIRHNGFTAVIPLVAWCSPWPSGGGAWTRRLAGAAIGASLCAAGWLANRALDPEPTHLLEYGLLPEDVAGTICYAPEQSDAEVREVLRDVALAPGTFLQARACALTEPDRYWEDLIRGPDRFVEDPTTPALRAGLRAGWRRAVTRFPHAYLAQRAERFAFLLGFTHAEWAAVYTAKHERAMLKDIGRPQRDRNIVQRWLGIQLRKLGARSVLFRPYLYLLLALGVIIRRLRDPTVVALSLSSLGYLGGLFFVAPAPDLRYAQWLILAALVTTAIHVLDRRESQQARASR